MKLETNAFENGHRVPAQFAFCDFGEPVNMADNRNPGLAWSELPAETKSLVLICHDPDVPSAGDDVNQEGREVPSDLPRVDFYHWVLVDIDPSKNEILEGEHSAEVTARGKSGPDAPGGARHGINDYTNWFSGDPDMEGDYFGYDGPCPPWNDSIQHHYHFTLYALDVDRCAVDGKFTGKDVLAAIDGHILDQAVVTGTYFLNKRLL